MEVSMLQPSRLEKTRNALQDVAFSGGVPRVRVRH